MPEYVVVYVCTVDLFLMLLSSFEVLIQHDSLYFFLLLLSLYEALPTRIPQDCLRLCSRTEEDREQEVGDSFFFFMLFNFQQFSKVFVDQWMKDKKCHKRCMTWLLFLFHILSVFSF